MSSSVPPPTSSPMNAARLLEAPSRATQTYIHTHETCTSYPPPSTHTYICTYIHTYIDLYITSPNHQHTYRPHEISGTQTHSPHFRPPPGASSTPAYGTHTYVRRGTYTYIHTHIKGSPGHQVIRSSGHQVVSSSGHQLIRSGHQVTRSSDHQIIRSSGSHIIRLWIIGPWCTFREAGIER